MSSDGEDSFEDALNVLVSETGKSSILRNDLQKDILEAVTNLGNEFANKE